MDGRSQNTLRTAVLCALIGLGLLCAAPIRAAVCGDGVVTAPETCDPPNSAVCDCCCGVCLSHAEDPACACCRGCRSDCTYCGDGVVNPGEQCDDGNLLDGDGCNSSCRVICGDGVVVPGFETCDPPDAPLCDCCQGHDSGGGCSGSACRTAICAVDPYCCAVKWDWACADLAAVSPACACCNTECDSTCFYCGDGVRSEAETCEPPGSSACNCCTAHGTPECSNPVCTSAVCAANPACCQGAWNAACVALAATLPACTCCQLTCGPHCINCGDAVVNGVETCDPPGTEVCNCCTAHASTTCTGKDCQNRVCGLDDYCCTVAWDSVCAALAAADPVCSCCNDCRSDCTFCGDGIVAAPETCDPGITPCNCCSAQPWPNCSNLACTLAVCAYDPVCCAVGWDAICADEAKAVPACVACCNTCRSTECTFCGDGNLDPGETCDDGNLRAGDGCEPTCHCTDTDGDGTCDVADNCPLTANPGNGVALFDQTVVALDKGNFGWPSPANIDWVWGDLQQLPTYGIAFIGSSAGATEIPALFKPPVGHGYYWIVRPDCPLTSWRESGATECLGPPKCLPGGPDGNLPP